MSLAYTIQPTYLQHPPRLPQRHVLSFDVLVHLVQYLPLRDAHNFSLVCPDFFDAVYYVFSHRTFLDFSTLFHYLDLHTHNTTSFIALPDDMILQILHAHTRVETVIGFHLPPFFHSLSILHTYLGNYLHSWSGGHITGQLRAIVVSQNYSTHNYTSPMYEQLCAIIHHYITPISDFYPLQVQTPLPLTTSPSWSTINLDHPYITARPGPNCIFQDSDENTTMAYHDEDLYFDNKPNF